MTTGSMLTRWVYSIYTSFNILAELVAQIFPFVELVDLKLVLLCHFLYNVIIICKGWLFFGQVVIFLYRWLFFGQVVIFLVQVVIFWTGGYFSCTGGYFFAQRGYVFIMDTVILDILPK